MYKKLVKSATLTSALALSIAFVPVAASAALLVPPTTDKEVNTIVVQGGGPVISVQTNTSNSSSVEYNKVTYTNSLAQQQNLMLQAKINSAIKAEVAGKLQGMNLNKCDLRAANIAAIMNRVVTRGTNQTQLFTTIATRVESFYASKGLSLSNYSQLVTAVNNAAITAQTDLNALKSVGTFSCTSSSPQGQVSAFRTALQTEIQDLKAYRNTVKNLIVGVKSVAGSTNSSTSTSTNITQGGSQ